MSKELDLCSYKVRCSSKSAQEMVQVSGAIMVWHPALCSFLAIWAMYRKTKEWDLTGVFSPPYDFIGAGKGPAVRLPNKLFLGFP